MRMLKKKTAAIAFIFILTLMFALPSSETEAFADSFVNDNTGYRIIIEDDADLLTDEQEEQLKDEMAEISLYGNVAFKSIDTNTSSAKNYAEDYYYRNFSNNSGVVFLIDMDNRQLYLASSGEMYKTISGNKSTSIMDNVYRYASSKDYYKCASTVYEQILTLMEGKAIAEPMKHVSNAFLSLVISMLIFFIVITVSARTKHAGTEELVGGAKKASAKGTAPSYNFVNETKKYSPVQRSGGGGGGGGFSGGGGGGGFSGGGGGHGF